MSLDYLLPESLNKSNVISTLKVIQQHIAKLNHKINIDGSKVVTIDSAGVALLLELSTSAKFINLVTLINLSSSIKELCQLYQINL